MNGFTVDCTMRECESPLCTFMNAEWQRTTVGESALTAKVTLLLLMCVLTSYTI